MCAAKNANFQDVDSMVLAVDEILADINIGLLIYQLDDDEDDASLKLLYANTEAAHYTDADLRSRVGQYIYDAFPSLRETDLATTYAEVVRTQESRKVGVVEYRDPLMKENAYAVRAFPMPLQCVGIIFEDFGLRKQVHDLLRKQVDDLEAQHASVGKTITDGGEKIQSLLDELETDLRESKPDAEGKKLHNKILGISAAIRALVAKMEQEFSKD